MKEIEKKEYLRIVKERYSLQEINAEMVGAMFVRDMQMVHELDLIRQEKKARGEK